MGISHDTAIAVVVALALVMLIPFVLGLLRSSKALAQLVAHRVLPLRDGVDLADAPRRVLTVALQLVAVLAVGTPVVALTQPFLPPFFGVGVLTAVVVVLTFFFWRDARNLQGHVRAGAEVLVELLARQGGESHTDLHAEDILPGLGSIGSARIEKGTVACGKTLAELNLRARTGATVMAIRRGEEGIVTPSGHERLMPGDVVALSGTAEALEAAQHLLSQAPEAAPSTAGPTQATEDACA